MSWYSLHAATVRQAQQTLMVGFMVFFLGAIFGGDNLPTVWRAWFSGISVSWSAVGLMLAKAGVVLMTDLALLLAGMARFQ